MADDIVRLEDARALKKFGMPLTSEVVDAGPLPDRCAKLIERILKAADACRSAVFAYLENPDDAKAYAALKRKHQKLGREIEKVPAPNWVEETDGGRRCTNPEDLLIAGTVGPRCFAAFEQWEGIIDALDNGQTVEGEIIPWPQAWSPV